MWRSITHWLNKIRLNSMRCARILTSWDGLTDAYTDGDRPLRGTNRCSYDLAIYNPARETLDCWASRNYCGRQIGEAGSDRLSRLQP